MAFDFHIRRDYDSKIFTKPSCQIDEDLHERLFELLSPDMDVYPLLMESAEFVHDSFYETDDLAGLVDEITRAMAQLSAHPALVAILSELLGVCQEAKAAKLVLHGVAD